MPAHFLIILRGVKTRKCAFEYVEEGITRLDFPHADKTYINPVKISDKSRCSAIYAIFIHLENLVGQLNILFKG